MAPRNNMIEYHGWVTLCCTAAAWDDGNWAQARDTIEREVAHFKVEDGHWVTLAETTAALQTLQLSGNTDQDVAPLLRLLEFVGRTVPDSYGELVIFEGDRPALASVLSYRLAQGRVSLL